VGCAELAAHPTPISRAGAARWKWLEFLMNKVFGFYFPCMIALAVILNPILSKMGLSYSYAGLMGVAILAMLGLGLRKSTLRSFATVLTYVSAIFLSVMPGFFLFEVDFSVVIAAFIYILAPTYWVIYFSRFGLTYFQKIVDFSIVLAFFVGALGIVQYFFSPTLFGWLEINNRALEWAADKEFSSYSVWFRVFSLLGSPQVYGLFIALYVVVFYLMSRYGALVKFAGLCFLMFAGLLSGNKSFVLIFVAMMVFVGAKYMKRSAVAIMLTVAMVSALVVNAQKVIETLPVLERIMSLEQALTQEQDDSRLGRYKYILDHTNPLVGNGLGSLTNRSAEGIRAAESYFLKIYYEVGVIPLLLFVIFLIDAAARARIHRKYDTMAMIVLISLSMVVVHAFESPAFFMLWGLMLSAYLRNDDFPVTGSLGRPRIAEDTGRRGPDCMTV
jgi:hypothetical protein